MRHLVNGQEIELEPGSTQVTSLNDRLMVSGPEGAHTALSVRRGDQVLVSYRGRQFIVERSGGNRSKSKGHAGDARAPMPGQIVEVFVSVGDHVEAGQRLLVLEAMKMQHTMKAPFAGTVESLPVQAGDQVAGGQVLVHVEPD